MSRNVWILLSLCCGLISWPFIAQLLPNNHVIRSPKLKVNLNYILPGKALTINWNGTPIFIKNRTLPEIRSSRLVKLNDLKDVFARNDNLDARSLAFDRNRCADTSCVNWLVLVASCTHLGCVPEIKSNGWNCTCHGSFYDNSGRIISGPAPHNLRVPRCKRRSNLMIIG
ncbi:Ubiquinol-cytochrome c reductase iron-sulfur subunit [Candidatus Hodgkinia cicadicola]|uniref:Ubiquinol-cytochrome c reductase iron-sulfur subunit n=1 Tax=Candidatus Hodgkinia cicadicola TaxID=573658 RepID=A0ABX4MIF1_9HYPH|nr:Ubiquinol-cytochrome c reductase iron-sulfur subunit [Candidatus Hodgkinia cicadicola]